MPKRHLTDTERPRAIQKAHQKTREWNRRFVRRALAAPIRWYEGYRV